MVDLQKNKKEKEGVLFNSALSRKNNKSVFCKLLIFLFIYSILITICSNLIIYKDSYITLKVSQPGTHKIFDSGTNPDEIWIDGIKKEDSVTSSFNLNPSNIVKLIWTNEITTCDNMFNGCDSIIEMNFTNFDAKECSSTNCMFSGCSSLISLDLSGFITSNSLTVMSSMFRDCKKLISLNLSTFDTSEVTNFGHMLCNCEKLKWVDISNFNTEKITFLDNMFNGCKSLTSINLSNFKTPNLVNIKSMFKECESLKIIDFPNLDIRNVANNDNLKDIFVNCKNLEYINIKNFDSNGNIKNESFFGTPKNMIICIDNNKKEKISELTNDNNNCILISCNGNLPDYKFKKNSDNNCYAEDCFKTTYQYEYNYTCYQNCLSQTYNNNYICEDCHPDCAECEGLFTEENSNCKSCESSEKFLNYGNCVNNCSRGFYLNESTLQNTCKCELEQCLTCSNESLNQNLCTLCDEKSGFYPIIDNMDNSYSQFLNCSISQEGYYFNNSVSGYKLCYSTCKSCNKSGSEEKHNCIECKNDYLYKIYFEEYINCYNICSHFYYFDEDKSSSICTLDNNCPQNYNKLIEDKKVCTFSCSKDQLYRYEFRKKCFKECPENSTERTNNKELEGFELDTKYFCKPICNEAFPYEIILIQECVDYCSIESLLNKSCVVNYQSEQDKSSTKIFDVIIKKIDDLLNSEDYNTSDIENGKNEVIVYEQMTITLTTTKNQKNDENNNVTTINLGDCERILKEAYNISDNETLFMKKIDVQQEGMMIPKIEFDVYYKLNGKNLIKLNISYCHNSKIDISIPAKINSQEIDKYNSSSGYYNDICYISTTDTGTDITLKDRKNEFISNNKTLCQENCVLAVYNSSINKAKCSCDIVESSENFGDIKIDNTKFFENFIDIKNIANVYLLMCYKSLFTKKGLINNYGSYTIIGIILVHFIIIIIYYLGNFYSQIQKKIDKILKAIKIIELLKLPIKAGQNKAGLKNIKNKNEKCNKKIEIKSKNKKVTNFKKKKSYQKKETKQNPPIKKMTKNIKIKNSFKNDSNLNRFIQETNRINNKSSVLERKSNFITTDKIMNQVNKIMPYNDDELNNLEYSLALKFDNRKYCQYYYSLLKSKHALIFTFCNNTDYNLKIIKIDLFLFNFALFFAINAIFFNDDTMHKIYKNNGVFDIIGQLPQIIYSFIISSFFSFILEMLALTDGVLLDLKKIKSKIKFNKIILKLGYKIKVKFLLYFIISTIFLILFWYYLAMFCAIYANTQIYLIKDTLLSFIFSFIEPLGIYLIPGLFRIPSLSKKHKNRYILYKMSIILQKILI